MLTCPGGAGIVGLPGFFREFQTLRVGGARSNGAVPEWGFAGIGAVDFGELVGGGGVHKFIVYECGGALRGAGFDVALCVGTGGAGVDV